jgi:hypothetical protein
MSDVREYLILFTEVRVVVGFPAFINAKGMG